MIRIWCVSFILAVGQFWLGYYMGVKNTEHQPVPSISQEKAIFDIIERKNHFMLKSLRLQHELDKCRNGVK